MWPKPFDLDSGRLMLVNDDGIDAPGLAVLKEAAQKVCKDVWVIAPAMNQSATSRSMTLHKPIEVERRAERSFAIYGTPVDAVLIGLDKILIGDKPTMVLSGVNAGINLGEDVGYSGTVGAALEAVQEGYAAIAFSQAYRGNLDWSVAERFLPDLLVKLAERAMIPDVALSVNFPLGPVEKVAGVSVSPMGRRLSNINLTDMPERNGNKVYELGHFRDNDPEEPGTDLYLLRRNKISVTPLVTNLTALRQMHLVSAALD